MEGNYKQLGQNNSLYQCPGVQAMHARDVLLFILVLLFELIGKRRFYMIF